MITSQLFLFGGTSAWTAADWTASDDRVRGGSSQSYLTVKPASSTARFHGTLDITTLGGAGFASQRTATSSREWDLSGYDGIMLDVESGDGKMYTFIVKDEILPPSEGGREQAGISWEYEFRVGGKGVGQGDGAGRGEGGCEEKGKREGTGVTKVWIPWTGLKATYRGREKKDSPPLDLKNLRRFSLMMRSFFGTQEGHFSLVVKSISAVKKTKEKGTQAPTSKETIQDSYSVDGGRATSTSQRVSGDDQQNTGFLNWVSGMCIVS